MSLLSFLPAIIGGVSSLFKGNKTKYANQMTPEQQKAYSSLLQMLQRQAGGGSAGYGPTSDAMNILYQTFLGKQYMPSTGNMQGSYRMPKTGGGITPQNIRQPYV